MRFGFDLSGETSGGPATARLPWRLPGGGRGGGPPTDPAEGRRLSPTAAEGEGARASHPLPCRRARQPTMLNPTRTHLGAVETRSTARSGRGRTLSTEPRRCLPRRSRKQLSNSYGMGGGKGLYCIASRRAARQAPIIFAAPATAALAPSEPHARHRTASTALEPRRPASEPRENTCMARQFA